MSASAQDNGDPNLVGISIGSTTLYGWQNVRVTRSIETFPSSFQLELTERYPSQASQIVINPGDPVEVTFGDDTVITGYVDDYFASATAAEHMVRISGRSKCADLVDCSAGESPYQYNNTSLVYLARQLTEPLGITVSAPDGDSAMIPQQNVTLTESPFELLEPICRWANFIMHDDTSGNLVIERVGEVNAASGFVQGQNIQAGSITLSMASRYSEIDVIFLSTGFLIDGPPAPGSPDSVIPVVPKGQATDMSFPARADGQPRKRRLLLVSEQTQNIPALATQRAQWEMARRIGRSQAARITCDSWRDSAGTLWTPNTLAPINAAFLKLPGATWLIATVTYVRDERGTTSEIVLMPKSAFVPEPQNLALFDASLSQELPGGSQASGLPAPR